MSSLLVESPVSNSQLYFTWIEDLQCDDRGGEETTPPMGPVAVHTIPVPSIPVPSMPAAESQESCHATEDEVRDSLKVPEGCGPQENLPPESCRAFSDEHLDIRFEDGSPRIAKPVRIGGVMIQLLKRYGITDEEINAGLARYALANQQQAAS